MFASNLEREQGVQLGLTAVSKGERPNDGESRGRESCGRTDEKDNREGCRVLGNLY